MKKRKTLFTSATIAYIFLLIIDAFIALFSLGKGASGFAISFLGVSVDNIVTETEITTTFGLTYQIIFTYLLFILFCYGVSYLLNKIKK